MTIYDYIKKHGLVERNVPPGVLWIPGSLMPPPEDKFSVFGNDGGTHIVVINTTKNRFKITHGEIVFLESEWLMAGNDYQTDATPFWDSNPL